MTMVSQWYYWYVVAVHIFVVQVHFLNLDITRLGNQTVLREHLSFSQLNSLGSVKSAEYYFQLVSF